MNILLVGDNAVSHAIADKVARSAKLYSVLRRENPGIERISEKTLKEIRPNPEEIVDFASSNSIDYAIVVSRSFINAGTVDALVKEVPTIGPTKELAKIESDKAFAKKLMHKLGFATPEGRVAETIGEVEEAIKQYPSFIIRPSYYTMGRGTRRKSPGFSQKEAVEYGKEILSKGGKVLVEKKLEGEPFTLLAFSDGKSSHISPPVMVQKMWKGAASQGYASYSTGELLPFLSKQDLEEAKAMVEALARELASKEYVGAYGVEFLKTPNGVVVTGFSSTFSDPATLNIMPLMKTPMSELLERMWKGTLGAVSFKVRANFVKYFFPKGYPHVKAKVPLELDENCLWKRGLNYYFQGVEEKEGVLITTTSRTLAVYGEGKDLVEAELKVNSAKDCVRNLDFVEHVM